MRDQVQRGGSVVVPAVAAAHAATVLRSLGRRDVHTVATSERDDAPALWSRYCDERVRVPDPMTDAAGYRDALLALAEREDVAAIVPMREADQFVLSKHRDEFAEHVAAVWPTMHSLRAVHDRFELFAAAERAGVPVPETQLLTDVEDWDRERIVKGRWALLASDYDDQFPVGRFASPAKTIFLDPGEAPDVDALVDAMGHVPLAQGFVDGVEYCMRALYHDGEPVATSQKRLVRGYKYSRGPSIYHEAVDIPELERLGLALLDELDWEGMASVGFLRDSDGTFKLLEVNPRFPASVPMDVHAGVDYPALYWELSTTGETSTPVDYRPGTASHLVRGELVHLHSVLTEPNPLVDRPSALRTTANIAASVVTNPRFDHLDPRDPGPFLRDLVNMTTATARTVIRELDPRRVSATATDATTASPPPADASFADASPTDPERDTGVEPADAVGHATADPLTRTGDEESDDVTVTTD
ncbi:ATP-grasp domain-containing protein [Halorubellus sp. PRR65]|uniref:carboxylate--amine ligase n=1 Tax=Halorubellus sp. PRR65 TaxID=3098148 RepID=UPI002B2571C9|nr:ATP-grasp domain-containing protein [Halorubellus sp. PRR65]